MFSSLICYQNMCLTLKILLLHLKLDFMTLKSGEGWAALNEEQKKVGS